MTTGLTYTTYIKEMAVLAVMPSTDANFVANLPQMITYAENRIQRDLDFLQTQTTLTSRQTANGVQTVTLGSDVNTPDFVVLQEVNVITPAGTTDPNVGSITPLVPVTKEWLRWVYPSSTSKATPLYFAPLTQAIILLGPWPDGIYNLQTIGTIRFDSLSASNTTTFISTYLPDLMLMASMIFISAFQRNFGRASDDPAMAVTYESQYKGLLQGAGVEEARKRFAAGAWSSMAPAPVATPTR